MKIGIDISQIVYGTGVSIYTQNLVKALLKIDKENDYLLFGGSFRRLSFLKRLLSYYHTTVHGNYSTRVFPIPPTLADFLWNQLHFLPIEKLIGKVDVFHSSDWTQPPTKAAKVTTIHDLSFLRWPKSVHPKVLAAQKRRLKWVKKEIDLIIAVSEATKKETIELLGVPEEKIIVIYEGPPSDVVDSTASSPPAGGRSPDVVSGQGCGERTRPSDSEGRLHFQPVGLKSLEKKLGISRSYLLSSGSQAPRKNIGRLISAFEQIKSEINCQLVITGEYQSKRKLPADVILTGFLPRQQWLTLLAGAEALVYPSLYEGFGLIILEAFTLGIPVVTSNVSSLLEVAGKAAILVDPLDVESIAEGTMKAVNDKKRLIAAGLKQVKKFSWEKAARETLKIYEKAYRIHKTD